jgi:hypothetical protein
MLSCRINGKTCDECGIVHGKEAEELRCAVEELIASYSRRSTYCHDDELKAPEVAERLQELLDNVDARDALAYVNATVKKRSAARKRRTGGA